MNRLCNQCQKCRSVKIVLEEISYTTTLYCGDSDKYHTFNITNLTIPICQSCGKKIFTEDVDKQIQEAFEIYKEKYVHVPKITLIKDNTKCEN